jgi:hypothetical protein
MPQSVFERISIPKPCHEDWNKMTPDQQGAFCKVCNKSVHDFSRKSAAEVEEILLKEEEGKVCGRFSTEQIPAPKDLEIPFHLLPKNISPFRAFALAVFLVFGTALFGITDAFGQGIQGQVCIRKTEPEVVTTPKSLKGDVMYVPEKKAPAPQPPSNCNMTKGEVVIKHPEKKTVPVKDPPKTDYKTMGMVAYRPPVKTNQEPTISTPPVKKDSLPAKEPKAVLVKESFIMGKAKIEPPVKTPPAPSADTIKLQTVEIVGTQTQSYTMGAVSVCYTKVDVKEDVLTPIATGTKDSSKEVISDQNLTKGGKAIDCYPNPSNGAMTLRYDIKNRCDVMGDVYDIHGQLVKHLFSTKNQYEGSYHVGVDLSDLANGTYIIWMKMGAATESTRVVINR